MLLKIRKGQSTAEYAILIGVVVGALIAMQIYVRRSLQAKMKWASDATGSLADVGLNPNVLLQQYEPYYGVPTGGTTTQTMSGSESAGLQTGGGFQRGTQSQTVTMGGNQAVGGGTDLWKGQP